MDIPLGDGIGDEAYLKALGAGLKKALRMANADLAIYLSGADPYRDDRFSRLKLTKKGLAERDQLVFQYCRHRGLPVAVTMGGGYARKIQDTVDIHYQTVVEALCLQRSIQRCHESDKSILGAN
jgi:acetoin utilization deacetylase AcuC-like enzyme